MSKKELKSLIPHIAIFGNTNVGKSSFINSLTNQEVSIVADVKGTTTDVVSKRMEILDLGPVVLMDTAGLNDDSVLGKERTTKSLKAMKKIELALVLFEKDIKEVSDIISELDKVKVKYILIQNKIDINNSTDKYIGVDSLNKKGFEKVISEIKRQLQGSNKKPLIADLFKGKAKIVHVMPIDSEAPEGRIILPQMRVLRECLDYNYESIVIQPEQLKEVIDTHKDIDLVITDSQMFNEIKDVVPANIALTSYSIIFARNKGDLDVFVEGVKVLNNLKDKANILIAEACSHNVSHEDIGQVKIPMLLNKVLGYKPNITHYMGNDFPNNLKEYDLVIHCGACMITNTTMINRMNDVIANNIPMTNYGVFIAYATGILDKAILPFKK